MLWTQKNYPNTLNKMDTATRDPAVEIVNDWMEKGREAVSAVAFRTTQPKKRVKARRESVEHDTVIGRDVRVVPHPDGWAVTRSNAEKASFVFTSISAAQNKALQISREDCVGVLIHGEDGQLRIALGRVSTVNA